MMPTTRILILSDGRPGHFNLSEGIAAALERLGPAETQRIDIRRGRWPGAVLAGLTRSHLPSKAMLRCVYGIDEAQIPASDIIVSAGAETLAASVWLARARRVTNVFYGSLRFFEPTDFNLVLTSYARNASLPRHALALKPSRLDPGQRTPPTRPSIPGTDAEPARRTLGLLIGGNAGPITYQAKDWANLITLVTRMAEQLGIQWLIANSRRTPDTISNAIAELAARPDSPIAQFLDVRTAGSGTLASLLLACDAAICTADSSSMISECVWARLPTLAVAPSAFTLTPNEVEYRTWMCAQGWMRTIALEAVSPESYSTAMAHVTPMPHNPQHALGELLKQRLNLT